MLKKISTIIVIIVVAMLTSAQTTESMKDKGKEAIPLYSYTEKELEKVSKLYLIIDIYRKNYSSDEY